MLQLTQSEAQAEALLITVRPIHAAITQTDVRPSLTTNTHVNVRPGRAATTQIDSGPVISQIQTTQMVPNGSESSKQ